MTLPDTEVFGLFVTKGNGLKMGHFCSRFQYFEIVSKKAKISSLENMEYLRWQDLMENMACKTTTKTVFAPKSPKNIQIDDFFRKKSPRFLGGSSGVFGGVITYDF